QGGNALANAQRAGTHSCGARGGPEAHEGGAGYPFRRFTTRAGTPATSTSSGTSSVTTDPAATMAPAPMVTPASTVDDAPTHDPAPTMIGSCRTAPARLSCGPTSCVSVMRRTNGPMFTRSPIVTCGRT